jgi:hypothetical protein
LYCDEKLILIFLPIPPGGHGHSHAHDEGGHGHSHGEGEDCGDPNCTENHPKKKRKLAVRHDSDVSSFAIVLKEGEELDLRKMREYFGEILQTLGVSGFKFNIVDN